MTFYYHLQTEKLKSFLRIYFSYQHELYNHPTSNTGILLCTQMTPLPSPMQSMLLLQTITRGSLACEFTYCGILTRINGMYGLSLASFLPYGMLKFIYVMASIFQYFILLKLNRLDCLYTTLCLFILIWTLGHNE